MILKLGSKSDAVKSIQQMLTDLGFHPNGIDGVFGPETEKAVVRFQEHAGIYADGIVGPITMAALEDDYKCHALEMTSPGRDSTDGTEQRLEFRKCEADKCGEGYTHLYLRQDAAQAYDEVRKEVKKWGGILTSSGGIRALDALVSYNRSATSFHYTGLALDLFIWSGLENPAKDPYVIKLLDYDKRTLEVFVRCKAKEVEEKQIDDVIIRNDPGLKKRLKVQGRFMSLTKVFQQHGFQPISARRRFFENGDPNAAEWWHFQYEKPLIPRVSTFGGELLKVYSRQRLEGTAPWQSRDRIFKLNWS